MASTCTVQKDDTLGAIAKSHGLTLGELLKANPQFSKNGRTPDLIYPGETVNIPARSCFDKDSNLGKGTKSCPEDKALEGEVIEVTFKSGIKVARNQSPVTIPHWQQGTKVDEGAGSERAAVYLIDGKGGRQALEVKVRITVSKNVSGSATLEGKLGVLEFTGSCPTAVGEHSVAATITKLPDAISWCKGDVTWNLNVPDMKKRVTLKNATRLEVFVVLGQPAAFYTKGVWVEALRFLCDKVGVLGEKQAQPTAGKIAAYCHGSHGLTYDTTSGASVYGHGPDGGTFNLGDYLKATLPVINCYDQAGGVQSLAGALGMATNWCFQGTYPKRFGFINTTNLVGVGPCNNPFFARKGSAKVVAATDPDRTDFRNHAFVDLAGKILDACAGPHGATETPAQYLTVSVDRAETTRRGRDPGDESDITYPGGVTDLA